MTRIIIALLLLALPATGLAGSVLVLADGTGNYPTIQAALDAIPYQDTVLVGPGIYSGSGNQNLNLQAKTLLGASGADSTVILCNFESRGISTNDAYDGMITVLDGISVVNGYSTENGGGLRVEGNKPQIIRNCVFYQNLSHNWGGAIANMSAGELTVENCVFEENGAVGAGAYYSDGEVIEATIVRNCEFTRNSAHMYDGGAMVFSRRPLIIENTTFHGNIAARSGGAVHFDRADVVLTECLFSGNQCFANGGAILAEGEATLTVSSCTISGNYAAESGGGICLKALVNNDVNLHRSIVYGNCAYHGANMCLFDFSPRVSLSCCCLENSGFDGFGTYETVGEQVYANPEFCGPLDCSLSPTSDGVYRLWVESPCTPENSPCGELIGALGVGCSEPSEACGHDAEGIPLLASPNPSKGSFEIRLAAPLDEQGTVEVFDSQGRFVTAFEMSHGKSTAKVDLTAAPDGNLPTGLYFVRLRSGGREGTAKAVILRQ